MCEKSVNDEDDDDDDDRIFSYYLIDPDCGNHAEKWDMSSCLAVPALHACGRAWPSLSMAQPSYHMHGEAPQTSNIPIVLGEMA